MKFILVCEQYPETFNDKVQKYLNEGYELRGKTFTTTVDYYKTTVCHYNQVLVKNGDKESEEK